MKIYDVIILGAGASGMMCATHLSKKKSIAVVETNSKVAQKLKISGGGNCNITNNSVALENFDGDRELLSYALKKFSKEKLLNFLERNRVALELRKGRYYFCKDSSDTIIDLLKSSLKNVSLYLEHTILEVIKEKELFCVRSSQGVLQARSVVVATGGKSYEKIGASDIGLQIAKSFSIEVEEFTPALVGLTLQKEQFWMRELSGLSCVVKIRVADRVIDEEMLFTHKGISGPAILSASLYWKKGSMEIDFLPEKNILEMIEGSKKVLSSAIGLPKRLAKALLNAVDLEDKECRKVTIKEREKLKLLHKYSFSPAGNFGFSRAEVSRGGVLSSEIVKESMEAKKVKGLYFIGEVVDITGELGGYNFQWAFSSAYVCANALK